MATTRVFKSGNSQAVRLPKEFRFHVDEVEILRRGGEIVLREPKRNLGQAFTVLGSAPNPVESEWRIFSEIDSMVNFPAASRTAPGIVY